MQDLLYNLNPPFLLLPIRLTLIVLIIFGTTMSFNTIVFLALLMLCNQQTSHGRRVACAAIYRPVCCVNRFGSTLYTASNACKCGPANNISNQKCANCTRCNKRRFKPKCCSIADTTFTTRNHCACKCNGGKGSRNGACEGCPCTRIFSPTCCLLDTLEDASNECTCTCKGGIVVSAGKCPICPCPKIFNPVCCRIAGAKVKMSNSCLCKCQKGKVLRAKRC